MTPPRMRQIHLDFHNGPHLPGIAADFDAEAFAATIAAAHVDSVTLFARCHHGYTYHPTEVGTMHPGLEHHDLLGAQISALHAVGVAAPIYITVGWDELMADRHPEWRQVERDGRMEGRGPFGTRGWRLMDLASTYAGYVLAYTEEVLRQYGPVDGIFFDICRQGPSANGGPAAGYSRFRLEAMREAGVPETDPAAVTAYALQVERDFMARAYALVKEHSPDATVFFNSRVRLDREPRRGMRDELAYYTHIEVESLPSSQWDYHHFPLASAYFQTLGRPILGMTGIFHKSWADFGGLKPEAALRYECARMLAAGAACSIGDQLHPRGTLDEAAYARIGTVYRRVRDLEPWVVGAKAVPEIGVLLAEGRTPQGLAGRDADEGAMRILMESHRPFQFIDADADLSPYRVVIAPDEVPFDPQLAQKVADYLREGGALLATHRAGLPPTGGGATPATAATTTVDGTNAATPPPTATPAAFDGAGDRVGEAFAVDFGVGHAGPSPETPEYLVAGDVLSAGLRAHRQVLYEAGSAVRPRPGTEVLALLGDPYFTRTHEKFTSHEHAPYARTSERPAITRHGRVVYCSNPLFTAYRRHAVPYYRELVDELLDILAPGRLVSAPGLPTTAEITVTRLPSRLMVHVIHAVPQRRGRDVEIVEDVLPLHDVRLGVRTGAEVSRVSLAPEGTELPHREVDGVTWVTVPEVRLHQVVVFESLTPVGR